MKFATLLQAASGSSVATGSASADPRRLGLAGPLRVTTSTGDGPRVDHSTGLDDGETIDEVDDNAAMVGNDCDDLADLRPACCAALVGGKQADVVGARRFRTR